MLLSGILGAIIVLFFVVPIIGQVLEGPGPQPAERVRRTVPAGTEVRLPNGTTLRSAGDLERYEVNEGPAVAVQVWMCGGGDDSGGQFGDHHPRNYFSSERFRLVVGDQVGTGFIGGPGPKRAPPPQGNVDQGECLTGWLLYHVPTASEGQPTTLRYSNINGDRITWRWPG